MHMFTSQRLIERSLRQYADRVAIVDGAVCVNYSVLAERTARLANALLALGASGARPVAMLLPNDRRAIEVDVAATRAGICRVAIGTRLSTDECRFIIEHSQAAILVTTAALWEKVRGEQTARLSAVLLIDGAGTDAHMRDYEETLAAASASLTVPDVTADHPSYILYTSGTTGRPKGAFHSQGGRAAALLNMLACEIDAHAGSAMLHCGPLSHGSGSKVLTFLALGARNILMPRFDVERLPHHIEHDGATHSFMVPTMLQMILDAGPAVSEPIRRMHQISFGGAPITNALFSRAIDGFGPILTQVYGSCEAPHPITVLRPEDYKDLTDPGVMAMTAGRASFGTDVAILDDDGKEVASGEEGELCVRGAHLMNGYWRDAEATSAAFREGGWYMTGDIAVADRLGYVHFRDRKRDLIISGGLNVYPSEVERVLAENKGVREVAVVSAPDDHWGEIVVACVVPHSGSGLREEELIDWVGRHLAGYKRPKRVVFMDELPKGSTNKVLKRQLKSSFWEGRERRIN